MSGYAVLVGRWPEDVKVVAGVVFAFGVMIVANLAALVSR